MPEQIINVIIGAFLGSIVPAFIAWWRFRRRDRIEIEKLTQEFVEEILAAYKQEVSKLRAEIEAACDEIERLRDLLAEKNLIIDQQARRIEELEREVEKLRGRLEKLEVANGAN